VRANTCVACHQTVGHELEKARHPELIFELDGQSVTEPKHWRETAGWSHAQTWLVGQAAALREMTWQMQREPGERLTARWRGLSWVLQKAVSPDGAGASFGKISLESSAENLRQVHTASDQLARDAAARKFSAADTQQLLKRLADTHADFADASVPAADHARRAERLVLALDRLVEAVAAPAAAKAKLDELFKLAQSLPDFEPAKFGAALREFSATLP
ncbi:MAG: hypothetical protein HY301_02940, partial [Verrucomicrobia bacterium]|nr:hypothetical protein [Verrucomicrobiota bacterium]